MSKVEDFSDMISVSVGSVVQGSSEFNFAKPKATTASFSDKNSQFISPTDLMAHPAEDRIGKPKTRQQATIISFEV